MFANPSTLLWVELTGIEIVLVHGGRVGQDIIGCCNRISTNRHIITMYKIKLEGKKIKVDFIFLLYKINFLFPRRYWAIDVYDGDNDR